MGTVISCSVRAVDRENLEFLKKRDGLGATQILRVGIQHLLHSKNIQREQIRMEEANKLLSEKVQRLAKRLYDLEGELKI